tara:strand:- start:1056 stop:1544 length:489 start_codon:yes stop_codon:yes gene_type:complete
MSWKDVLRKGIMGDYDGQSAHQADMLLEWWKDFDDKHVKGPIEYLKSINYKFPFSYNELSELIKERDGETLTEEMEQKKLLLSLNRVDTNKLESHFKNFMIDESWAKNIGLEWLKEEVMQKIEENEYDGELEVVAQYMLNPKGKDINEHIKGLISEGLLRGE